MLIERARVAIDGVDLSEGAKSLEEDFGLRSAIGWVHYKFGVKLDLDEVRGLEPEAFKRLAKDRATKAYDDKEAAYPVMAGLYHFTTRDAQGQKRYDRESLVAWARERFGVELGPDDLKNIGRDEIQAKLLEHSRTSQQQANSALVEVRNRVDQLYGSQSASAVVSQANSNGMLSSLADWLRQSFHSEVQPEQLAGLNREELLQRLETEVEDFYRPEMRRMERQLVLEILDAAWKDHLLAMDHLRSSVGLRGYAQVDPKVEYKREGMRTYELMWSNVNERVTDYVFRIEQLDENFVGSTWVETAAIHEEAGPPTSDIGQQQQAAIEGTEADKKPEPIRNQGERVGRNDPCPCGSGKKFKNCCMRQAVK
jgi:preprotein translocase subunit SecA